MPKIVLTLLAMCCVLCEVASQPMPAPPPDDPPPVPITGIEILIGMGSLFGLKKAYDLRKRK